MKNLLLPAVVMSISVSFGQEVIGSAGTVGTNGTEKIQWTIGETVISTITNGTNTATQGFHQTQLEVTSIEDVAVEYDINVYPNPTNGLLQVDISDLNEDLNLQLYDAAGKLVSQKAFLKGQNSQIIDFTAVERGSYYLRVVGKESNQTISIIKQ